MPALQTTLQGRGRITIYVIGSPGAGKSTLCSKLMEEVEGWAHISVGDELRSHAREADASEDTVAECVSRGILVPADQLASIINRRKQTLQEQGFHSFIIDGFPRHLDQLLPVQDMIGKPDLVILVKCPKDVAKNGVLERQVSSRQDTDTESIFERRYTEYLQNNPAIIDHFSSLNLLDRIDSQPATEKSFSLLKGVLMHRGLVTETSWDKSSERN